MLYRKRNKYQYSLLKEHNSTKIGVIETKKAAMSFPNTFTFNDLIKKINKMYPKHTSNTETLVQNITYCISMKYLCIVKTYKIKRSNLIYQKVNSLPLAKHCVHCKQPLSIHK